MKVKNNLQSLLDPALGVNRMWTKRNDHAPKSEYIKFLYICPKRTICFSNIEFDHSLVLSCLVFTSKKIHKKLIKFYYNNFSMPRAPTLLY